MDTRRVPTNYTTSALRGVQAPRALLPSDRVQKQLRRIGGTNPLHKVAATASARAVIQANAVRIHHHIQGFMAQTAPLVPMLGARNADVHEEPASGDQGRGAFDQQRAVVLSKPLAAPVAAQRRHRRRHLRTPGPCSATLPFFLLFGQAWWRPGS